MQSKNSANLGGLIGVVVMAVIIPLLTIFNRRIKWVVGLLILAILTNAVTLFIVTVHIILKG